MHLCQNSNSASCRSRAARRFPLDMRKIVPLSLQHRWVYVDLQHLLCWCRSTLTHATRLGPGRDACSIGAVNHAFSVHSRCTLFCPVPASILPSCHPIILPVSTSEGFQQQGGKGTDFPAGASCSALNHCFTAISIITKARAGGVGRGSGIGQFPIISISSGCQCGTFLRPFQCTQTHKIAWGSTGQQNVSCHSNPAAQAV